MVGGEKGTNPEEVWFSRGEGVKQIVDGRRKSKKKYRVRSRRVFTYKNGNRTCWVRLPFLDGVKDGSLGVYLPRSFSPIW